MQKASCNSPRAVPTKSASRPCRCSPPSSQTCVPPSAGSRSATESAGYVSLSHWPASGSRQVRARRGSRSSKGRFAAPAAPTELRASALLAAARIAMNTGDYERTVSAAKEALELFRASGDERGAAAALRLTAGGLHLGGNRAATSAL